MLAVRTSPYTSSTAPRIHTAVAHQPLASASALPNVLALKGAWLMLTVLWHKG